MKEHFFALHDALCRELRADEVLLAGLQGETSDFVRFTQGRVRQAGSVTQRSAALRLVHARRQLSGALELAGDGADLAAAREMLAGLRAALAGLPEDPWLAIEERPAVSSREQRGALPAAQAVVEQVTREMKAHDFVGFYAGGTIARGCASSLGARHWHEVDSFNFDWSVHLAADRAVKAGYAGFAWEDGAFAARAAAALEQLERLRAEPRRIAPGEYRAYLAPRALDELLGLLAWGAFSARARATRQSPLLRMQEGARLSPQVTLSENTAQGIAPAFQGEGFAKPPQVVLVRAGALADALVSPRSAKEYGFAGNAASAGERPEALDLAAGTLQEDAVLAALDTGLYISNLWYLNFSDRPAGRVTGMTRFATFWVERGRVAAPVAPMRFDDSIYRMLGENLEGLTRARELLPDPSTYEARSTASARLPGALLRALRFTL